jgi:hypothetical protein
MPALAARQQGVRVPLPGDQFLGAAAVVVQQLAATRGHIMQQHQPIPGTGGHQAVA